jgi:hypothetical protein
MRKRHVLHAVAIAFVFAAIAVPRAGAEVHISGSSEKLVLQVQDASLPEILSNLRAALHLEVELKGSTDLQFNGTYKGSVRRVLALLLRGVDYVANVSAGGLQLVLVAKGSGPRPGPAVATAGADDLGDPNDPVLAKLAAAAAGHEGSRAARIRRQRTELQPNAGPDY